MIDQPQFTVHRTYAILRSICTHDDICLWAGVCCVQRGRRPSLPPPPVGAPKTEQLRYLGKVYASKQSNELSLFTLDFPNLEKPWIKMPSDVLKQKRPDRIYTSRKVRSGATNGFVTATAQQPARASRRSSVLSRKRKRHLTKQNQRRQRKYQNKNEKAPTTSNRIRRLKLPKSPRQIANKGA